MSPPPQRYSHAFPYQGNARPLRFVSSDQQGRLIPAVFALITVKKTH